MNAAEITTTQAFQAGSDLWVVKNDPQDTWWQEIDFRSGFLLSQCLHHHQKAPSVQLNEILELTEIKRLQIHEDENLLLVGSADHFHNKWILLWNQDAAKAVEKIQQISGQMKTTSVRFFSESKLFIKQLQSSPKTSLTDIAFIENT